MSDAFQKDAFQNDAFQIDSGSGCTKAFQDSAFQNDAFQVCGPAADLSIYLLATEPQDTCEMNVELTPVTLDVRWTGGGAGGYGKPLTLGELVDLWANEQGALRDLERQEAERQRIQEVHDKDQSDRREKEDLTEKIRQAKRRLAGIEEARRLAEHQAAELARQAREEQKKLDELEEEEAIAMATIALLL